MNRRTIPIVLAAAVFAAAFAEPAGAEDTLTLAVGQRGNWNTAVSEIGERAGFFRRHGLKLDILYTAGGGESQQALLSGAVDIGTALGTMGVLGAYAKGAPIRIIAAETTGGADYWYAAESSPIKSLKDGNTIAFSTFGASTHGVALTFIKEFGLKARPVATGGSSATLVAVMTGQIDIGWAAPPFGLKEIEEHKIRLLARASDLPVVRGQTIRVLATRADVLDKRRDAIARYMDAYRETVDYIYGDDPKAILAFAEVGGISPEIARRTREMFDRPQLQPDEIKGLDVMMPEAVKLKFLAAPLTADQNSRTDPDPAAALSG